MAQFDEYYQQNEMKSKFTLVITCFFIDTGLNIFKYIKTIYDTLQSDGLWINVGPLQYHHEHGVMLAKDELLEFVQHIGFQILSVREFPCKYTLTLYNFKFSNNFMNRNCNNNIQMIATIAKNCANYSYEQYE